MPLSGSLSLLGKWPRFELWTVNLTWKMTETLPPHQKRELKIELKRELMRMGSRELKKEAESLTESI